MGMRRRSLTLGALIASSCLPPAWLAAGISGVHLMPRLPGELFPVLHLTYPLSEGVGMRARQISEKTCLVITIHFVNTPLANPPEGAQSIVPAGKRRFNFTGATDLAYAVDVGIESDAVVCRGGIGLSLALPHCLFLYRVLDINPITIEHFGPAALEMKRASTRTWALGTVPPQGNDLV